MLAPGGSSAADESGEVRRKSARPRRKDASCHTPVVTNDNTLSDRSSAANSSAARDEHKRRFEVKNGSLKAPSSNTDGAKLLNNKVSSTDAEFNKLYLEYYGPLTFHVQKLVGSRDDASDIVHNLFLDLIEKKRLEGLDNPKAYLYRAARNAAASHFRTFHAKRFTGLEHDEDAHHLLADEDAVCAETEMIRLEEHKQFEHAMAGLKDRERKALEGFYILGRQWKEVAEDLGVSISTAKNEARGALWMLRLELGREGKVR